MKRWFPDCLLLLLMDWDWFPECPVGCSNNSTLYNVLLNVLSLVVYPRGVHKKGCQITYTIHYGRMLIKEKACFFILTIQLYTIHCPTSSTKTLCLNTVNVWKTSQFTLLFFGVTSDTYCVINTFNLRFDIYTCIACQVYTQPCPLMRANLVWAIDMQAGSVQDVILLYLLPLWDTVYNCTGMV